MFEKSLEFHTSITAMKIPDMCLHQCPGDHSWSTVAEELEIKTITKSRVQLDAHVKVV
jgi:hypothetical protein